ncbi:thiamine diphosphokinase [Anaerococcus sp. AGMB00486]|uniref:Thiamine diphosphokinase n=2 Tax=Anaerococcus TaxID=165779 RepID=A0ABX2NBI2_9FIRM|nr:MULTISPECIES: thiamine diphosphokinase [Anaerococcus]MDY3005613.1 thiamine diphosphokinase [Anaerococcus porci]MSS78157.1 thiamine diphosphokinase [Anaerococcus porci]NVF12039.1 thiamine diphosphokinase [Anaerococcus faecalis]
MKKCFIFAGGDYDGFFDKIEKNDYVIGVDRGYTYLNALKANLIIGDFDSSVEPNYPDKIVLKPEKDVTDLYAALEIAIKKNYKNIIVYGGLGGRLSHTIANIKILFEFKKKGINISLKSKNKLAFIINKDFKEEEYIDDFYVSVFALEDDIKDLSLKNLKYELNNYNLKSYQSLGVSNETLNKPFEIKFSNGMLLVIYERKSAFI